MYFHDKRLQYPVRVTTPDPAFARILQQAIGGVEGGDTRLLPIFLPGLGQSRADDALSRHAPPHRDRGDRPHRNAGDRGRAEPRKSAGRTAGGRRGRRHRRRDHGRWQRAGAGLPIPNSFPQSAEEQEWPYTFVTTAVDGSPGPEGRWSHGPSIDGKAEFDMRPMEGLGQVPVLEPARPGSGAQAEQIGTKTTA